ncbi:MAG TPA: DUF3160 domain-containing protein [Acidimicrobiia bacterium]|nr:DUF3160 domain-containing protein [Acidimicrobiia bacterium]
MRPTLVLSLLVAMLLAACTGGAGESTTISRTTTTGGATSATVPMGVRPVTPFAAFPEVALVTDSPAYAGPGTPTSLDRVLWVDQVPEQASRLLAEQGFVVVESDYGQFHEAYSHVDMSSRQPLFVTTDAAYHYWHLAFAKALRDTEQRVLLPILEEFALALNLAATADAITYDGTAIESNANRVERFSELLLAILELDEGPYSPTVAAELLYIEEHLDVNESPTTAANVDYSLFQPRGHYTSSPELTRYFLAMSALGLTAFQLSELDQTRTGLILAKAITDDEDLTRMWGELYEPTAFLVGLADDYTPLEVTAAADAASPGWREDPGLVADDSTILAVISEMFSLRPVGIDPELASIRVMGVRFVLDSYILDQLVEPNVAGRLQGSPLDIAASFGSAWAHQRQVEAGIPDAYPDYEPQLEEMTDLLADRAISEWAATVYDGWLYAIQPIWSPHGAAYPDFMQTPAWAAKAHNAGFGSYTELKHDTILYAKQAFAEGETPPVPAEPRHWVEPEPVVYARLAALARLLGQGLGDRGLLADEVAQILEELASIYDRFERLALDELAGRAISEDDNRWLETIGSRFELIWLLAAEDDGAGQATTGGFPESPNDIAAVVADIMSNPSEALEIGTGYVDRIYVLVPNDDGQFQVARGGVYSFYEFWVPRDQRLTDEEWRQMLADGGAPARPSWTEVFIEQNQ